MLTASSTTGVKPDMMMTSIERRREQAAWALARPSREAETHTPGMVTD
jgi:hypothetical protein